MQFVIMVWVSGDDSAKMGSIFGILRSDPFLVSYATRARKSSDGKPHFKGPAPMPHIRRLCSPGAHVDRDQFLRLTQHILF
jgi:hypothetical protein